jgi:hydrogenase maturation protease
MTIVVIGLGNDLRRDDGIGPTVARAVAPKVGPDVQTVASGGDPVALLELWAGADLTVIVDAVICDPPRPGVVHRLTPAELDAMRAGMFSTHGISLNDAMRLGAVLDRLPRRMVILAVEIADLDDGRGLSPAVGRAVDAVVSAVLSEIGAPSERVV